jgi:hypothetical protein
MSLEPKRGLELFFKKIEANYSSSFSYVFGIAPLQLTLKDYL